MDMDGSYLTEGAELELKLILVMATTEVRLSWHKLNPPIQ